MFKFVEENKDQMETEDLLLSLPAMIQETPWWFHLLKGI